MTCYNPIPACYSKSSYAKTGKKTLHLLLATDSDAARQLNEKYYPKALYEYIFIPCKKCVGCRSDNAKMWSLRAYNETKMHKFNCFITLTYDNESDVVADDPLCIASLRYKHFQNFMKRLRKRFPKDKIGYLVCGEYGLKDGRAHWHAILFGFDFPDKQLVYVKNTYQHYFSQILQDCWSTYNKSTDSYIPIGFIDLCNVDYDCCAYVSQYVMKKLPVDQKGVAVGSYICDDGELKTIELTDVAPPIIRSSRNPAVGLRWYKKYGKQACENGFITVLDKDKKSHRKIKTPSYYLSKFELDEPEKASVLKSIREEKMKDYYKKNPIDRQKLSTWQESHLHRIKEKIKKSLTIFKKSVY